MNYVLPDLCDEYPHLVHVAEPVFRNFGGRDNFGGPIVTIKCHEDNSLVAERVAEQGDGQVLVVDGGGSMRCGLLGDNLARNAADNGWAGVVVFGCVRDVDELRTMNLGIQALASHPLKSVKRNIGLRDEVLQFAGITVVPGHYLYADNNGLLVSESPLAMPD